MDVRNNRASSFSKCWASRQHSPALRGLLGLVSGWEPGKAPAWALELFSVTSCEKVTSFSSKKLHKFTIYCTLSISWKIYTVIILLEKCFWRRTLFSMESLKNEICTTHRISHLTRPRHPKFWILGLSYSYISRPFHFSLYRSSRGILWRCSDIPPREATSTSSRASRPA